MRIKQFAEIPNGTVFKVMKESTRVRKDPVTRRIRVPVPPAGMFVKLSNSRSQSFSHAKDIIIGLTDVVQVIAYPSEKAMMFASKK